MKCPLCFGIIPDDSVFCTNCGTHINKQEQCANNALANNSSDINNPQSTYGITYVSRNDSNFKIDEAGCLAILISFLSPFIGIALYLVWRDFRPHSAKNCLIVALVSFGLIVLYIIVVVILSLIMFSLSMEYEYPQEYIVYLINIFIKK